MAVRVFQPIPSLLAWPAMHMRERDRLEFGCLTDQTAFATATDFAQMPLIRCIGRKTPEVVLGGHEIMPGVWWAAAYATDGFREIALSATRHAKALIAEAVALGGRRIETRYLTTHEDSRRWLHRLGFKDEATFPFGRNGEEFTQCALQTF